MNSFENLDGVSIQCIYADKQGVSHCKDLILPVSGDANAPSRWTPAFQSDHWSCALPYPSDARVWHTTPTPALSILLSGQGKVTVGSPDGAQDSRTGGAGTISLYIDNSGYGHFTEIYGSEPACVASLILTPPLLENFADAAIEWPEDAVIE